MKEKLQHYSRQKLRFVGTIEKLGWKGTTPHNKVRTLMLKDVAVEKTGEEITDHVWLKCGKWSLGLQPGDKFSFEARVQRYEKGYKGFYGRGDDVPIQDDYRLTNPTKVKVLKKGGGNS